MAFCLFVLVPGVPALGAPPRVHGVPYESIVAVVDTDVVTQGELVAEWRIARALSQGPEAITVPIDKDALQPFLDVLIARMLVAKEARRMGVEAASDEAIEARVQALRKALGSPRVYHQFLSQLTMDPALLRAVLARDVQVERYTEQRLRTRLVAHRTMATAPAVDPQQDAAWAHARAQWLDELRRAADIRLADESGRLVRERWSTP